MKKFILTLVIIVILLILGFSVYYAYSIYKYNFTPLYSTATSVATQQKATSTNEIVGQKVPGSFLLTGKMLQIRIDSTSKSWWGQSVIAGGAGSNNDKTEVSFENLAKEPISSTYYAKIFQGDCTNTGASKYILFPLVIDTKGTVSQTLLPISLDALLSQTPLSIHIYQDANYNIAFACGTIDSTH